MIFFLAIEKNALWIGLKDFDYHIEGKLLSVTS
jgi:hypothetical protein